MKIDHCKKELKLKTYIESYRDVERFIGFCKACEGYGKTWACPPFEVAPPLEEYEYITIIGSKIYNSEQEFSSTDKMREAVRQIFDISRLTLDDRLLEIEARYPTTRTLFPGSCRRCPAGECTRLQSKPCIMPDKMRPSLEALGFDLGRTTSEVLDIELKWGSGTGLPPYYTLVYGVLSHESLPNEAFNIITGEF